MKENQRKTLMLAVYLVVLLILVVTGVLPWYDAVFRMLLMLLLMLLKARQPAPWESRLKRWLIVVKLVISW